MSELVVLAWPGEPERAAEVAIELQRLGDKGRIGADDAVLVTVDERGKASVDQAVPLVADTAARGALAGLLAGFVLTLPFPAIAPAAWLVATVGGAAAGGLTGAYLGSHKDIGIPDDFVDDVASTLPADSSALFVLVHENADAACRAFGEFGGIQHRSALDAAAEASLRAAIAAAIEGDAGGRAGNPEVAE